MYFIDSGTYDEVLLLNSRLLVFSMSSEAPCFPAMVLAAHYMGLRPKNTVLLVQPMLPPQTGAHSVSHEYMVIDAPTIMPSSRQSTFNHRILRLNVENPFSSSQFEFLTVFLTQIPRVRKL